LATGGRVLLVNPWIYDFAAYNFWVEPLGLLTIAAALRGEGYHLDLIDCLAPHPGAPQPRPDASGKFLKTIVDKPAAVAFVPRRYGRYGLPLAQFDALLARIPSPDLVLVASGMTYWYPGVVTAVDRLRARFGPVPVALGGIYATLCPDHARRHSGADRVIEGPGLRPALELAARLTGRAFDPGRYADPCAWPPPARDLAPRPYAGLLTAWGCPYRCPYCAAHRLQPAFLRRDPAAVVDEIAACAARGIRHLAFYDDALLLDAERHIIPILEGVLARGLDLSFHTPNGLHAAAITPHLAALMRRADFAAPHLSLETIDPARQRAGGGKVTTAQFERAVAHLRAAGFPPGEMVAYLLAGLPGQPLSQVEAAVRFVRGLGLTARLALFSPIPGTPAGDHALPPGADLLLHNNTVYPYLREPGYLPALQRLKQLAKGEAG
jgi:radical SAM superfamily enzyme YgiQ (UPF0313 family)